jgi:hypothetical protein
MVMVKGWYAEPWLLYDVADPVHPRLLCKIANTSAHLFTADTFEYLKPVSTTETDVVLHSLGSGNESVAGKFPLNDAFGTWQTDLSEMAYMVVGNPNTQVWLYAAQKNAVLFSYQTPRVGCICRFGIASPFLAFSADGQYLVAGAGVGLAPMEVYRVADRVRVATLSTNFTSAFWDRVGDRLFVMGTNAASGSWTPGSGVVPLAGATAWPFLQGLSPDGSQVGYTAYSDPDSQAQPRVFIYDVRAATTRMLLDKIRTQVVFVRDGWVWYLEEDACDPATCTSPVSTIPTGNVLAMQLSTGTEVPVTFGAGENPVLQSGGLDFASFAPGEFWPSS